MEGALSRPESLHDHLILQLRVQRIEPAQFHVGELLVQNLDDNGFHLEDPITLVNGGEKKYIPEMIKLIQGFDPVGTCTVEAISRHPK